MTQEEFFKRYTYLPSRDRIGGGGFGTVYKAKDTLLHRTVAIKVSEVKLAADGKKTFSLKDEFDALKPVPKHPNIANYEEFYSFESPQGIFDYAVMQYYPDGNLSDAIKQGLTAEQKEDIATQLLEGIGFLHKHKVVHRDLKPSNILIVRDGGNVIPLITDFGLSKATGMGDNSVFSNSFGGGTPRYSSPEQLQGKDLRLNTDLWSYGAILYELFTGQQLFSAGSGAANTAQADLEIYNKIVNGDVRSLRGMPETWRRVAERCLVVDPTKRAKDAAELFAIIKGDETEVGGSGGAPPPPEPEPDPNPNPKKGLWIGLGIAALVALMLIFLWPKPQPIDPDTQAFEACETVEAYRAYMRDYGDGAQHYADAQAFVARWVADSTAAADSLARVMQEALALAQARQQAEADSIAQAEAEKKEVAAYKKCTTIDACEAYLKAYPDGRYVEEVKAKLQKLKQEQKEKPVESTPLLPLPISNGRPDLIYYFRRGESSIDRKNSKSQDALLKEALNTYNVKGFRIYGWASPDEQDYAMPDNYAQSVEGHIKSIIKQSGKNVNSYSFETKAFGPDWMTLIESIQNSDISNRDDIVMKIHNSSYKEKTIREMLVLYPKLEELMSTTRRAEVFLY